jgi:hypothetical protein
MDASEAWAASGAMAVTGRAAGPPALAPGRPALAAAEGLERIGLRIPGVLGERAAYAGLRRNGPWSCGGATRVLPSRDGHITLSLPRPTDLSLVPALVEADSNDVNDPWAAVAAWASRATSADAEARIQALGLAGGLVATTPPSERPGVLTTALGRRAPTDAPLVVDLTSLWAGPLCAHLLGLRGARVIKVESTTRPDGARLGPPAFFDLLHRGHDQLTIDFTADLGVLRALMADADLVLEASRPRALRQLGIVAEEVVAAGTSWLSITARGRSSDSIGFGDDVAACAGQVIRDGNEMLPVGDALADPLTGIAAAAAAFESLASDEARLIDVSMLHVVAATTGEIPEHQVSREDGAWWLETAAGRFAVARPEVRP